MAWPESLSADEQAAARAFCTPLRSWAALLSQLNVLGAAIGDGWFGGLNAIIGSLQDGDVIPNDAGLDGSRPLTKADVTNLALWAWSLSNPANGDQGTGAYASVGIQQTCVKAAGINASVP